MGGTFKKSSKMVSGGVICYVLFGPHAQGAQRCCATPGTNRSETSNKEREGGANNVEKKG